MKKLVNDPKDVVREMLKGVVAISPSLALLENENVVVRADLPPFAERREVAVISGGGSGHEPAHVGYVGKGMLHAAVAGEVFTSPSADSVLAAIRAVCGPKGALLIVKNYSGDRFNFGLAAELAMAEGFPIEIVVVADDVALIQHDDDAVGRRGVGRRGIAGTVFVHKIAGAIAATEATLKEVAEEAKAAATAVGTMGVALSACTVPAVGKPSFRLEDNEIEFGLGIHGEAGVRKSPLLPVNILVEQMLSTILDVQHLQRGEHIALLINNLGGTPTQELGIIARRVVEVLTERGIVIDRAWSGTFLTALEMAGVSISLMKVDEKRLNRLDAPTEASAWPNFQSSHCVSGRKLRMIQNLETQLNIQAMVADSKVSQDLEDFYRSVRAVATALEGSESVLTELDRICGDGDLGLSLSRGARAMREVVDHHSSLRLSDLFNRLGECVRKSVGGTSGPLYSIFLLRIGRTLGKIQGGIPTAWEWSDAFQEGCKAISELGGARLGDRTMLDAMIPAAEAFAEALRKGESTSVAAAAAVKAANEGAKNTSSMLPFLGRSSYMGDRVLGTQDPGAVAVTVWIQALQNAFRGEEKK